MNVNDIRARLEELGGLRRIDLMAAAASTALREDGRAFIRLTPGDATAYNIVITRNAPLVEDLDGNVKTLQKTRGYIVSLVNCSGLSYEWAAEFDLDPAYVAGKWTSDDRLWTGVVLAEFLNRLRVYLEDR